MTLQGARKKNYSVYLHTYERAPIYVHKKRPTARINRVERNDTASSIDNNLKRSPSVLEQRLKRAFCFNYLLRMLFMNINDLLHLVVTAHEDARAVVDMLRHYLEHPAHLAVDGLPAG